VHRAPVDPGEPAEIGVEAEEDLAGIGRALPPAAGRVRGERARVVQDRGDPGPRSTVPGGGDGGAAVLPCAMLVAAAPLAPAKLRPSRITRRRARAARYSAFRSGLALGPGFTRDGPPSGGAAAPWAAAPSMPIVSVAAQSAPAAQRV
jgi:hypothetical protein